MTRKRYSTKQQRSILESIGIAHVPGRTSEEAENLINEQIKLGQLSGNVLSPPTEKQVAFLTKHGVPVTGDVTKEVASELIEQKIEELDKETPISDRQFEFIQELGGVPSRTMTRFEASEFIDYLFMHGTKCSRCGSNDDRRSRHCPDCGAFLPTRSPIRAPGHIYEPTSWMEWFWGLFR